jgi:hypothetical protein
VKKQEGFTARFPLTDPKFLEPSPMGTSVHDTTRETALQEPSTVSFAAAVTQ